MQHLLLPHSPGRRSFLVSSLAYCPNLVLAQVVQPVFNLKAEEIGLMGEVGEQPALRLGYDDFNESASMPEVGLMPVQARWPLYMGPGAAVLTSC